MKKGKAKTEPEKVDKAPVPRKGTKDKVAKGQRDKVSQGKAAPEQPVPGFARPKRTATAMS